MQCKLLHTNIIYINTNFFAFGKIFNESTVEGIDEGIVGDDTDGHIDDTVRFVNEDTVLSVVEHNTNDENYDLLQHNLKQLKTLRLLNGKQLNIVELPMPSPVVYNDQRF